jgi:hypothetical protein
LAKISVLALASLFIAGCTLNFPLPSDEPLRLAIFQKGRVVSQRRLGATDLARLEVNRWLAANPDGWSYAFATRDPRIYMRGKNFYINVSETEVAVKYCRGIFNCHFWVKKDNRLFVDIETALGRHS